MSSMLTLEKEIPFDACRLLSAAKMPSYYSYLWREYALASYGIPTIVWDVFYMSKTQKQLRRC
jgi:hypothetical protein